ncbi:MAG: hypothetical protein FWH21_07380 [Kiritimatiellaeota bacterium]|nr:hypothetical protein [Kiritimatiellota bacterium]
MGLPVSSCQGVLTPKAESPRACVEKAQPLECGGSPPLSVAGACPRAGTVVGGGACVCSGTGAWGKPHA